MTGNRSDGFRSPHPRIVLLEKKLALAAAGAVRVRSTGVVWRQIHGGWADGLWTTGDPASTPSTALGLLATEQVAALDDIELVCP